MKLKQVIRENTDTQSILKEYFNITGKVTETANGISVDGNVDLKDNRRIEQLPVAFDQISGRLDLTNAGLENLNNFPRSSLRIYLDKNPKLTSLATPHPFICELFSAQFIGIRDLTGFQGKGIAELDLTGCSNLESLDGTSEDIGAVVVTKCGKLTADLTKYKNIDTIDIDIVKGTTMPLARILAFGSSVPAIMLRKGSDVDEVLWKIVQKYQGKGPENILDIMRDLRDVGYKNNARL